MPVIKISGFPAEIMRQKQIKVCKGYLKRSGVKSFWITEVDDFGENLKEATVEIPFIDDAYAIEDYANKVPFQWFQHEYQLSATIVQYEDEAGVEMRNPKYKSGADRLKQHNYSNNYNHRDRSRSPMRDDPSKIDMEIELIRKKRLLIEEERKLLEEKKKLESVMKYGVDPYRDIDRSDRKMDAHYRQTDDVTPPKKRKRTKKNALPMFILPCKILLKQMREFIDEKVDGPQERTLLVQVIRSQLRRRFASILEGKAFMPANLIVDEYRKSYPVSDDKPFILKMLAGVQTSVWPGQEGSKKQGVPKKEGIERGNKKEDKAGVPTKNSSNAVKQDTSKPLEQKDATVNIVDNDKSDNTDNGSIQNAEKVAVTIVIDDQPEESSTQKETLPRPVEQKEKDVAVEQKEKEDLPKSGAVEADDDPFKQLDEVKDEDWGNGVGWTDDEGDGKAQ